MDPLFLTDLMLFSWQGLSKTSNRTFLEHFLSDFWVPFKMGNLGTGKGGCRHSASSLMVKFLQNSELFSFNIVTVGGAIRLLEQSFLIRLIRLRGRLAEDVLAKVSGGWLSYTDLRA